MSAPLPTSEAAPRGRRAARASGDDRERAILTTAEQLLEERPLGEISVEDLARGAGISRPTFYFYFPSKDAVLLTLVDRMVEAGTASREEALVKLAKEPRAGWRMALQASFEAFGSRRAVILAAAELRTTNAEARELWSRAMEGWVADVTEVIESERARGVAPAGRPARDLAIALLQMNERAQYATFAGESPALDEDEILDVLVDVWVRAIYGAAPEG
jgi:AcrR family transcriptional regulator